MKPTDISMALCYLNTFLFKDKRFKCLNKAIWVLTFVYVLVRLATEFLNWKSKTL